MTICLSIKFDPEEDEEFNETLRYPTFFWGERFCNEEGYDEEGLVDGI